MASLSLIDILQKDISTEEKIKEINDAIDSGVDINATKKMGIFEGAFDYNSKPTPITYAIAVNIPLSIVELLLEKGGDPYIKYQASFRSYDAFDVGFVKKNGNELLELFKLFKKYNLTDLTKRVKYHLSGVIATIVYNSYGSTELLKYVLEHFNYDLNEEHYGAHSLSDILFEGNYTPDLIIEKGKLLIESGNYNLKSDKKIVFHLIKLYYYLDNYEALEFLKYIIQQGASLKHKDTYGRTSYQWVKDLVWHTEDARTKKEELLKVLSTTRASYTQKRKHDRNNTAVIAKKIKLSSNNIKVYNIYEADEVSKTIKNISDDKENIYFKAGETVFNLPRSYLTEKSNIYYECHKILSGAPYKKNVKIEEPYILIRGTGNYLVSQSEINNLLNSSINMFSLEKTNKILSYVSSRGSIMISYNGRGLNGRDVDITSADHCQEGSQREVYKLIPIEFSLTGGGGRRRRSKTCKSRQRGTKA